jgi:hypothetical protein
MLMGLPLPGFLFDERTGKKYINVSMVVRCFPLKYAELK